MVYENEFNVVLGEEGTGRLHLWYTFPSERLRANLTALKKANRDTSFLFVMVRYPYPDLKETMDKLGLLREENAFIDAKTRTVTPETDMSQRNVLYMKSPQNLHNIATAISTTGSNRRDAVVVIDSFTTLAAYNNDDRLTEFLEDLRKRLRTLGLNAIMFQDDQTDERLSPTVLSHFDTIHSFKTD